MNGRWRPSTHLPAPDPTLMPSKMPTASPCPQSARPTAEPSYAPTFAGAPCPEPTTRQPVAVVKAFPPTNSSSLVALWSDVTVSPLDEIRISFRFYPAVDVWHDVSMKIYNNSAGDGPYYEEDTEALAEAGMDRIYDCAPAVACARLEFSMKDGKEGALGLELKTEGESFYTELDFENATVLGFSYCLDDSVVVSAATAAPTVSAHPTFAPSAAPTTPPAPRPTRAPTPAPSTGAPSVLPTAVPTTAAPSKIPTAARGYAPNVNTSHVDDDVNPSCGRAHD